MDGNVAWIVQVSDLHISAYHPDRADDLARLLGPALKAIRPHLLLITGDITDAKNRKRTSTRQDESEWIQYRSTLDSIVGQSGIEKKRIFDIRGNHDKYGVPYVGSSLDFFSSYSISSQLNRLSNIHSISLVGNGRTYMFLGIDDTMYIGIRGPSNLFGHPTDDQINALESELQYWDNQHPHSSVTKVVFGHFPMSFTASSEKGERYETIFARQSVSAYICGHLHAKFSKQLWKHHTIEVPSHDSRVPNTVKNKFWEWELGDWKESKLIRILAVDEGEVSFVDMELYSKQDDFQTTILVTYPTNSRSMNHLDVAPETRLLRNDINTLVFSVLPFLNVTAKVFDSSRAFKIVEEPLQPAASRSAIDTKPLYHAKWNAENYRMLLSLPKLPNQFMNKSASYQKWAASVSIASPIQQKRFLFTILWFLFEGSRSKALWSSMEVYLLCLLRLPWFWGHVTSENGDIAPMYMFGWRVNSPRMMNLMRLGNPDTDHHIAFHVFCCHSFVSSHLWFVCGKVSSLLSIFC